MARRHNERCKECKQRVHALLERLYGGCARSYKLDAPTPLASYRGEAVFGALESVAAGLEGYGRFTFEEFVKSKTLRPCDYWVPQQGTQGFVVEFDESQHFTHLRKLALLNYPDDYAVGFDRERWINLCEEHDSKDGAPPYRDEQRAWCDTLRDLVPVHKGFGPTVRLYARDLAWCSLDPENDNHRECFKAYLRPHTVPRA